MKKLTSRIASLFLAGVLTASMTACGGSSDKQAAADAQADAQTTTDAAQQPEAAGDKYQVGVILKTTASEYWGYVIAGVEAAEAELGNVEAEVYGATGDTDFDGQQNIVETIVNAKSKQAIAVAPLNSGMINTTVTGAEMPVLAIDTNFDAASTFIGTAHEDAAYQGGKYVAGQVGEGADVLILANIQGELTSESRVAGYTKALEEGGCNIVATLYTDGVGDKAVNVMEGALSTFPELDAVVCCADDVALGAARAITSAGAQDKGILICGFDGISSGVQAVVDGTISCTVAQDPYNMGYQCVKSLVDAIEGKELPEFIDTGCNVITPENAAEYLAKLKELVP